MAADGIRHDFRQSIKPVGLVFIVMAVSFGGYFGSRQVSHDGLHQVMALVFGTTYFLAVALGPLYVFTETTLRGVNLPVRVLAAYVNPFIWMTKEVLRLTESHPIVEALYWYLNPLNIWLISLAVFEMGIATLIARRQLRLRGEDLKVVTPAPVIIAVASLVFVISVYAWGKGENVYVLFLEGYRHLFGAGTGM
jgi:hypothetical protein